MNGTSGRNIVYAVIYAACGIISLVRGVPNIASPVGIAQVFLGVVFLIVALLYLRRKQ